MAELLLLADFEYLNVSNSVGRGGVNHHDDVLVVQALLKLIPKKYLGGIGAEYRPFPTGTLDKETLYFIKKFQSLAEKVSNSKVVHEGRINKATERFAAGTKRIRTIIALNDALIEGMLLQGFEAKSSKYYIVKILPSLREQFSKFRGSHLIDL